MAAFSAPRNALFLGVTPAPVRAFLGDWVDPEKFQRVILPCVGRWGMASTLVNVGFKPEQIEASDICLYSTLIGYLADPRHSIDSLGLANPEEVEHFTVNAVDDFEHAAGVLLAMKYAATPGHNAHAIEWRRELRVRASEYRLDIADALRQQVTLLDGVQYDVRDVREVAREVAEAGPETICYVAPPTEKGGYAKQFAEAEELVWRSHLPDEEWMPDEMGRLLEAMAGSEATVLCYIEDKSMDMVPDGWRKVFALSAGMNRTIYLLANRDIGTVGAVMPFVDKLPHLYPIYDDEEITADSKIEFVSVDKDTCLYYRDLFVHKLGQTKAERYVLMLIDGRVTTACGLHTRDVLIGRVPYVGEVFGISITSKRYPRLGKLCRLLLTTEQFHKWMLAVWPDLQSSRIKGLSTTLSMTTHHEDKACRGVWKLVKREPRGNGYFRLIYRGEWRDETFNHAVRTWLAKWGAERAPDAVIEEAGTPVGVEDETEREGAMTGG